MALKLVRRFVNKLFWHHKARSLTSPLQAVSSLLVIRPTTVVSSANLIIELEAYMANAVVGEQGVQERAEHTPLWDPSGERQRSGDVVSYLHHLGAARKSRTQLHREGLRPRASSLMMSLEGTVVLNAEL